MHRCTRERVAKGSTGVLVLLGLTRAQLSHTASVWPCPAGHPQSGLVLSRVIRPQCFQPVTTRTWQVGGRASALRALTRPPGPLRLPLSPSRTPYNHHAEVPACSVPSTSANEVLWGVCRTACLNMSVLLFGNPPENKSCGDHFTPAGDASGSIAGSNPARRGGERE